MTTTKLIFFSAIPVIALSFLTCKKENNIQPGPGPGAVNGTVSGVITDLTNTPVGNATVTGGTATTTTDAAGKFTLTNVQFTADSVVVNVSKDGFFQGSKKFASTGSTVTNAKIQLIPKTVSTSIAAASGGNVPVTGGASVDFTSGFVNASNGNPYTGFVAVFSFYLNPADQNFNVSAPGDLKPANGSNQPGVLHSYGVVAVDLNDGAGNKIQLAAGKTAIVTFPISSALLSNAPSNIPLWYFDDTSGIWKKEGTATKQGNNYIGTVSHFTFWSAGDLNQSIILTMRFTLDTGNTAYANKLVKISRSDSTSVEDYTDNTGTISGLVPANEVMSLKVFDDCHEVVYDRIIGPFSADTDLGSAGVAYGSCASLDTTQYLTLIIDGKTYSWPSFHIRQSYQAGDHTFIMGTDTQITPDSSMVAEGLIFSGDTSPGNYPIAVLITINGTYTYQAGGMAYDPSYAYPIASITKYEAVGGYIEGTISGYIKTFPSIPTADSFTLEGSFRVKRIQ